LQDERHCPENEIGIIIYGQKKGKNFATEGRMGMAA